MVIHTFTIRGRELNFEAGRWFLFGVTFDTDTLALMFGPFEVNVCPIQTKAEWDWLFCRLHIWRRYWLKLETDAQFLFGIMPFVDHLAFDFGPLQLCVERGCPCCWPGSERYREESMAKWRSQVVRGRFPDRTFDVVFWQEQGDENIFDAAWEMVELTAQVKGSSAPSKPPFRDVLSALNRHGVHYLIVGEYGVMKYTEPLYTDHMEIWVEPSLENAKRAHGALAEFGVPTADLSAHDLSKPGVVLHIGTPPAGIDMMTTIDAVAFPEAWKSRVESKYDDIPLWVISLQDLIRNH